MPPPGGFEAVKYKRNLPLRGPSSLVILGAVTGICAWGFYKVGKGNLEKRDLPPTAKRGHRIRPHAACLIVTRYRPVADYGSDRELAREKVWSRIHLVPLLLAEGDRDAYRREQAALGREQAIMKDVKGWEQ
ncbi:hypothetical protein C0993_008463 [Termitomyces sp. T159_Od127]|nr:hypothetical protein C0993_008463 [Termitomyces sp. T159_Od127]